MILATVGAVQGTELEGGFVVPFVVVACLLLAWALRWRGASAGMIAAVVAFVGYLGLVVSLTLFPITIGPTTEPVVASLRDLIHLRPFDDFVNSATARRQAGPNILLGVPFGLLLPMLGVRSVWKVIGLGLVFGVGIESLQFVEDVIYRAEYRTVDINDVILNWFGVAIGLACFRMLAATAGRWLPRRRVDAADI